MKNICKVCIVASSYLADFLYFFSPYEELEPHVKQSPNAYDGVVQEATDHDNA